MQVEETKNEGLTREFAITVPGTDIEERVTLRLTDIGKTVNMPGFRPGKVPMPLLRKQYGPSVIGEVLERAISDVTSETLREKNLRPAMQPKIQITDFDEGKDLKFSMAVEIMPEIDEVNFGAIKLERLVVDVDDAIVDEAIQRMADEQKAYDTAVEMLEQALAIDPVLAEAERTLAGALDQLGREEDALGHLRRYLELKPQAPDAQRVSERIRSIEAR